MKILLIVSTIAYCPFFCLAIRRNSRTVAAKNAAEGEMMEKTEADYKNWVPAGMIRGFLLGSAAALLVGEKHRGENR